MVIGVVNLPNGPKRDKSPDRLRLCGPCIAAIAYGTSEGTFPFRYLSEKKLKQENQDGNQNKKYLV